MAGALELLAHLGKLQERIRDCDEVLLATTAAETSPVRPVIKEVGRVLSASVEVGRYRVPAVLPFSAPYSLCSWMRTTTPTRYGLIRRVFGHSPVAADLVVETPPLHWDGLVELQLRTVIQVVADQFQLTPDSLVQEIPRMRRADLVPARGAHVPVRALSAQPFADKPGRGARRNSTPTGARPGPTLAIGSAAAGEATLSRLPQTRRIRTGDGDTRYTVCGRTNGELRTAAEVAEDILVKLARRAAVEMRSEPSPVLRAEGLTKSFGAVHAVDGVDLRVDAGAMLGLLGPNGAGKTTTVRMLSTLVRPDAGRAWVAGYDLLTQPQLVRRVIGLSGQYAAVDDPLTGYENLYLVARFYGLSRSEARHRARRSLERFGLDKAGDRTTKGYSGGMRRRLDLAGALIGDPALVILDEPTAGLDPRGRQEVWAMIEERVTSGTSVLLTTQYLEEADRLADAVAVLDRGRIIARGSPAELKATVGGERLEVEVAELADLPAARSVLAQIGVGEPVTDEPARRVTVPVDHGGRALIAAVRTFDAVHSAAIEIRDIRVQRPNLDDVFLALTGKQARERT